MRKFLSLVAIMVIAISAFAQDPQKETVIVEEFVYTAQWKTASETTHGLRGVVLQAFIEKGRFNVVDAEQNAVLKKLNETRKANTEESVNASNVLNAESAEVYKSLGAKYLIQGNVTIINSDWVKKALSDEYNYRGEINVTLTIHNIADGSIVGSEALVLTGYHDDSSELAVSGAVQGSKNDIMKFVDRQFPFTTHIEQVEKSNKKGEAQELYIVGGTEMGVQKGQTFVVKLTKTIGSRTTQVEIGKLKAKEVMDGLTLCVVTKGGLEIADEYKKSGNFSNLVVISDKMVFNLGRDLLGL